MSEQVEQVLQQYLNDDVITIINEYDNSYHSHIIKFERHDDDVCCDDDHCCNCGCWIMNIILIGGWIGIIAFVVWIFLL